MDAMDETPDEPFRVPDVPDEVGGNGETYRPRGYQLEMLEESLRQNIIVAMDTGSGKTQIAVLRIIAELEISGPSKLVWFLAPTVALSVQQHGVIASQIPAVKTRVLTGLDNVERWTTQSVWDTVLQGVRVVVSTHAVLADALSHGFVTMGKLALIVFDEAHHCTRRHPANKIMQGHYHPTLEKFGPSSVPRIMGLTASPIVRSNKKELEIIETNLNAVCITPRTHRTELLEHVHRPVLERIQYPPCDPEHHGAGSQLLGPLISCIRSYDMGSDPHIVMLRKQPGKEEEADEAAMSGKTYCLEQLTKFREQCIHIYEELGGWATDYLIVSSIAQLENSVETKAGLTKLAREERAHMVKVLMKLPDYDENSSQFHVSAKLEILIQFLEKMDHSQFSGLLFVRRRATVKVMSQLLCVHPNTRDRFRTAPYVGWSNNSGRKDAIGDLLTRGGQRDTLAEFKSGLKNLIVATDVLEEGLDVSSCSLVICYDKPANLKSFVQRRGRARHHESTYAIMTATDDELQDVEKWQSLEKVMVEAYLDDQRRMREASTIEDIVEEVSDWLEVPATSARLSAEDIMSHLYHFCDILPSDEYTDNRPMFTFNENPQGLIQSIVTLPNSVHPDVRRAQGQKWWQTEHAARKEAAFQAYKALYEHGLLNDNLLPLTKKPELEPSTETVKEPKEVKENKDPKSIGAVVECSEQYDPFVELAEAWSSSTGASSVDLYQTDIIVTHNGAPYEDWKMSISLPKEVSMPAAIPLYWKPDMILLVQFAPPKLVRSVPLATLNLMRETTALFLQAPTSKPLSSERDFVALFTPTIPLAELSEWLCDNEGNERAVDYYERNESPLGIIRDMAAWDKKGLFQKWILSPGQDGEEDQRVDCEYKSVMKRRNFLQPRTAIEATEEGEIGAPKFRVGQAEVCTVARLPAAQASFGLVISALLDQIENFLVVKKLNETVLQSIGFNDLGHVLTAITTPFAHPTNHYQVYEFIGDSILKFTVSAHLFFRQPTWHEGYLTESFAKIVENKRLTRASLDAGLDKFILKRRFTPRRWIPPLISTKQDISPGKRDTSSKVLADVVESLIGAAYLDGGLHQAQKCIHHFLPEVDLFTEDIGTYLTSPSPGLSNLIDQNRVTQVIGYAFNNPSLLAEALTHPSCEHDTTTQSYQRMEYLGDAVLDMVIVSILAAHPGDLTQGQCTLIKHAVVNANLLAFFCMNHGAPETQIDIMQTDGGNPDFTSHQEDLHLWQFLRFNSAAIAVSRDLCIENYYARRERISNAIEHAGFFPWELLSQMNPDKFLSDIVESVVAAIFIDSGGNLEPCHAFLERIGLLGYVNRILQGGVNVVHPRNAAQEVVKNVGILVFKSRRIEIADGSATYTCTVTLNKEELASIDGCVSAEEAEVRLSYLVIRKVVSEGGSG